MSLSVWRPTWRCWDGWTCPAAWGERSPSGQTWGRRPRSGPASPSWWPRSCHWSCPVPCTPSRTRLKKTNVVNYSWNTKEATVNNNGQINGFLVTPSSRKVTWPECWSLIGPVRSRDQLPTPVPGVTHCLALSHLSCPLSRLISLLLMFLPNYHINNKHTFHDDQHQNFLSKQRTKAIDKKLCWLLPNNS